MSSSPCDLKSQEPLRAVFRLNRKRKHLPRQGGELDTFSQAILANCLPREGRSQLPRGFLFRKPEPFVQDLQLAIIIPTMVEESFENEFRALLSLVAHLKEGLGPKGPCPLAIPRRWCGGTSDMVTAHGTETLSVALRVPAHAPWLARRSLVHRVTRMTCHAPVRTGGAVGAGWDLD